MREGNVTKITSYDTILLQKKKAEKKIKKDAWNYLGLNITTKNKKSCLISCRIYFFFFDSKANQAVRVRQTGTSKPIRWLLMHTLNM